MNIGASAVPNTETCPNLAGLFKYAELFILQIVLDLESCI